MGWMPKGVYVVVIGQRPSAVGECHESFIKIITGEIGTILPATCYRDGDAVACRINALICRNRKDAGIYALI